ncbi:MAG: Brp/Blh family beta-carotene 15,15'-dioxygenase [Flavobacteriaceae bacterium]
MNYLVEMKFNNYLILITFFTLWITGFLYDTFHQKLALFLILTVGMVHGANDILIIKKNNPEKFHFGFTILKYLLYILFFGVLYYFLPRLFLLIFILFSAYHFGEQHWLDDKKETTVSEKLFAFSYGGFILTLLLGLNFNESQQIIQEITSSVVPLEVYQVSFVFCALLLVVTGVLLFKGRLGLAQNFLRELLILAVLAIIFERSTILWGFGIYFIIWHSIPSIRSQMLYLYKDTSIKSIFNYFSKSFIYWFVSICGLMILIFLFRDDKKLLLSILFPFIAALTFPHALVINDMFKKKT